MMAEWVEIAPGRHRLVLDEGLGLPVASDGGGSTIPGVIVKEYEHLAHQFPQWVPRVHGEKHPYPHVVETFPGSGRYKAAFKSKREVDEFQARNPRWGYDRS